MGLMEDLGRGPAGVDTAIFIYFIEEHPQFLPLVEPLFRAADQGRIELTTSALTYWRCWSSPIARETTCSQAAMTQFLRAAVVYVWLTSRAIICALQPNSERQAESKFPMRYNWRPLWGGGCTAFVTNDRDLPAVPGIRILQLASYLRS